MAKNVVWWRLKYPERAYAYVGPFLFGEEVADMHPKYYPVMIHAVERCVFTDDYFTERERDVFKKYIMENMSIAAIAKSVGRSPERIRQIFAKTMRKLHGRKITRKLEHMLMVPLSESQEFRDARYNYEFKNVYLDSWPKNKVLLLRPYLLKKFYPNATFEDGDFTCCITKSGTISRNVPYQVLIETIEESGLSYEEFFSDITYDNCELLNQFFMEAPYIKKGSEIRTIPTVPHINFYEIARNRREAAYEKPQVIDPTPFSTPRTCVSRSGVVFSPRDTSDELPGYILNPWLYKCSPSPKCIIWYLRDIKIIDECDRMVFHYIDKKIADRFYDAVRAVIAVDDQIKALQALFNDTAAYRFEDEVVKATNTLRENADKVRSILLTATGSEKGKFMTESDKNFREFRKMPVQNILKPAQMTRQINNLLNYKNITSCSKFVTMVINEEITTFDLQNDVASINILNRMLARVRYINYSTGGGNIFWLGNVVIPHLAVAYDYGKNLSKNVVERKTKKIEKMDTDPIPEDKYVYNAKVTNPRVVKTLKQANKKTIGDLMRALYRSDRDLSEIPGITQEDVYGLIIYAAYMNNDCTGILKKKQGGI